MKSFSGNGDLTFDDLVEIDRVSPDRILYPVVREPFFSVARTIYQFLSSAKLAILLLVAILLSSLIGVTILRGERAGFFIFRALWFNGLLVLLVVNIACCFFPRIWGRRLTPVLVGMVLFHLSFVAILGGIIYNSLFYFKGLIRLTEGETLPSQDPASYDAYDHGRFFRFSDLKGETSLVRMLRDYKVGGEDKRAAYEIAVGDGGSAKRDIIYITHSLTHRGVSYFNEKEGYSILIMLYDKQGKELYGAFVPLQSLKQKDKSYLYTTGTKEGPGTFPFPQGPLKPLFALQAVYRPSKVMDRGGEAYFQVRPLEEVAEGQKPLSEGKAAIGEKLDIGEFYISAIEVRYWVGMMVRYEPGKPIVLTSLWVGLAGMIITFIGRVRKKRRKTSHSELS